MDETDPPPASSPLPPLVAGRDYYIESDGRYVFTAAYLLARGTCCGSGCRHCPYGFVRDHQGADDSPEDGATPPDSA